MFDNLTTNDFIFSCLILIGVAIGYLNYSLYRIRKAITGVRSNIQENIVEAEVIADWTEKCKEFHPGSSKGKAYRNRLREVGHPYRGD